MPMIKIGQQTVNDTVYPLYLLQGNATRDAESKPVNGKEHTVVGIAASENKEGKTVFVNLNGWRKTAAAVGTVRKGDSVLAVGALKSRDYNGQTYYDLDADFVVKSGAGCSSAGGDYYGAGLPGDMPDNFAELPEEGDGELPF